MYNLLVLKNTVFSVDVTDPTPSAIQDYTVEVG